MRKGGRLVFLPRSLFREVSGDLFCLPLEYSPKEVAVRPAWKGVPNRGPSLPVAVGVEHLHDLFRQLRMCGV